MKKYLAFILMFSLLFSFNACSSDSDDDGEEVDDFSWKGDWNDPDNENYNGYYNPIEGDWLSMQNPKVRLIFDDKLAIIQASYYESTGTWSYRQWSEKYEINDIAIKYELPSSSYREYKIVKENGYEYLYMRFRAPRIDGTWRADEWTRHRRYTE